MTADAATVVAALHVSQRIKDYGSYAGFAAVLGLAVLALLYFAQAREVKRLREWAGRAPERDAELQARVTAGAQQRTTPAPAAVPAKPVTAAATPAGQAKPVAPAATPVPQPAVPKPGVPAPATAAAAAAGAASASPASATPPKPGDDKVDGKPAAATPAGVPPAATPASATPPKPGDDKADGKSAAATPAGATPAPGTLAPGIPAPTTPAGATPAPGAPTPAAPGAAPGNGSLDQPTQITPPPAGVRPAVKPGQPLRPPPPPPVLATEPEHSPLRATLMIVGGVLAVIVVAVVLVTTVFSGSDKKSKPNTIGNTLAGTTQSPGAAGTKANPNKTTPVSRGDVTVAVLNGTTVPGLARGAATKLQSAGFKIGTVTNAPDQARSATVVTFQPGHQAEGRVVARLIGVGADAVKPIDQSTQVVAGQEAFVVVTVGADQSR